MQYSSQACIIIGKHATRNEGNAHILLLQNTEKWERKEILQIHTKPHDNKYYWSYIIHSIYILIAVYYKFIICQLHVYQCVGGRKSELLIVGVFCFVGVPAVKMWLCVTTEMVNQCPAPQHSHLSGCSRPLWFPWQHLFYPFRPAL